MLLSIDEVTACTVPPLKTDPAVGVIVCSAVVGWTLNLSSGFSSLRVPTTPKIVTPSFILLEANYDPDILKYSKYPFQLKQRILSPIGHLSNESSGKTITELTTKYGLKSAMLGHLSKENNFPELALKTVTDELQNKNVTTKDITINVASRDYPSQLIKI